MAEKIETIVEKYKIWDVQNKQWFRPTYPGVKKDKNGKPFTEKITEEILFSQSGEMYMRKNTGVDQKTSASIIDCDQLEHVSKELFIPCLYSGWKDSEGNKWYEGDLCKVIDEEDQSAFVVTFQQGSFRKKYPQWDEDMLYSIIDSWDAENFVRIGHILETPELFK